MKTRFFLSVGIGLMMMTLSSWDSNDSNTVNAIYLGYMVDEDLDEEYYSFEAADSYLDFYSISPAILKKYDLSGDSFEGSEFKLTYSEDDESGELILESLSLME